MYSTVQYSPWRSKFGSLLSTELGCSSVRLCDLLVSNVGNRVGNLHGLMSSIQHFCNSANSVGGSS